MKNSIIYIFIGIALIILIGGVQEKYLENLSDKLIEKLSIVESLCQYSDMKEIVTSMDNLMKMWEKQKKILGIFIDHQDIHKIEVSLIEIDEIIKNNLIGYHISTNFALLKLYIRNITEENKFTIENIL